MGGFVRFVARTLGIAPKKAPPPPPQPAPAQTAAATPVQPATTAATAPAKESKKAALGSGYGTGDQTVMTSTSGVEEEANTQKTVLGGASSAGKKKKTGKAVNYG